MSTEDIRREISAHEAMLLEATENVFSDKTQVVKNLLKSSRKLFSQEVLDQCLLSCCRNGILILMPAIVSAGANLEVTDQNGNTPLLLSALYSHRSCARYLIGAGANVNAANVDGNTSLMVSVLNSASIWVTNLLVGSKDVRIDHVNNNGYTALLYAIEIANLNAVKLLIDAGASSEINETSRDNGLNLEGIAIRKGLLNLVNLLKLKTTTGKSPLLHAALNRDLESAQSMISMDYSILHTTNDSFTSIMIEFLNSLQDHTDVLGQQDMEMFEFLLAHLTANPQSSSEKEMIMDIAISIGENTMIERLSKSGFIISNQNLFSAVTKPDFLSFLLTKRHVINKYDRDDQRVYVDSPLYKAMSVVELDSAKALIQHGAFMDIDLAVEDAVKSNQVKSLQFLLSEFPYEVGHQLKSPKLLNVAILNRALIIIPFLLDCGADINGEYQGDCCLTQATEVDVLELLLSKGADPNVKIGSRPHTYPLHECFSRKFKRKLKEKWRSLERSEVTKSFLNREIKGFVECLLQNRAQVDPKDGRGRTALHRAARKSDSVGILKLLIDHGANVNAVDYDEETPLWKAVVYEQSENVQTLIDAGTDINFVSKFWHVSVLFQATNENILKILLDNGAVVKTINGESPLNSLLAISHIGTENVKRLIDAGCDVNHKNNDGRTVLTHATQYADINLLELLVQKGADVNASTSINRMLTKLLNEAESVTSCLNYLMDHNVNIDFVNHYAILALVSTNCLSPIPRCISTGLIEIPNQVLMITPLSMALISNESDLARYFINIKYLMKSDIDSFYEEEPRLHLEEEPSQDILDLLKSFRQQPLSLETLCFVVISDTLGHNKERISKVQKLGLPQLLQDSLLFKNAPENNINVMGTLNVELLKMSLEKLGIYVEINEIENDNA